jgi:hypothetical protein
MTTTRRGILKGGWAQAWAGAVVPSFSAACSGHTDVAPHAGGESTGVARSALDGTDCPQAPGFAAVGMVEISGALRGLQTAVRSIGLVSAVGRGRNARRVASTR